MRSQLWILTLLRWEHAVDTKYRSISWGFGWLKYYRYDKGSLQVDSIKWHDGPTGMYIDLDWYLYIEAGP